jgi:Kef-type K+ transport system membrane component KefB
MNHLSFPIEDNVFLFFALLFIVLVAPILSKQIKLPGIVGVIIAGVIVGPNGLNIIGMSSAIELLGEIGLLYIMLLAGLEINLLDFKRNKNKSLVFGLLTFTIPQVGGTLLFRLLGFSWPASILIASMFASHTLVGYPIITKLGITRNRAVLTTVGGTIFTDTLALLVLAVIARSVGGVLDLNFWVSMVVLIAIYVAAVVFLLPMLGRWFFRYVDDGIVQFHFVLGMAFLGAFLAGAIGIEPIVGAFLTGLVINRMVPASSQLMNRVQFVGNSLFIPFFLLYIGMIVDVEVLVKNPASWAVMAIMLIVMMLTKLISSNLTQRIFNFSKAEGWVIFGLSTTQAAATLAATLVGYELGIIGEEILNGVVLMILASCIIGPWVVEHFGRKIAFEESNENFETVSIPHVMVPLSNPANVEHLLSLALVLKDHNGTKISALSVITEPEKKINGKVKSIEKLLENAKNYTISTGVELNAVKKTDVNIAHGIARAALDERADLLAIGWNGKMSAQDRIFGTVLDQLLDITSQSILVCKIEKSLMSNARVVFYLPPSSLKEPGIFEVLKTAIGLAKGMSAPLHLLVEIEQFPILKSTFSNRKDDAEIFFHTFSGIHAEEERLDTILRKNDLLVAVGARRKTMSWLPFSDKLPQTIANKYSDWNFIIAYPGIPYEKHEFQKM